MVSSRRQVLRSVGGAGMLLAGLGWARRSVAQLGATSLAVSPLRDGLFQISGAGGNVVVAVAPEGLLVVDSGSAQSATELTNLIAERFGATPIRVLFNTHWHLDHTGGNDAMVKEGVTAIAHENTRLWMSTTFSVEWEQRRYRPRAPGALPNKTFVSSDPQPQDVILGKRKARYAHLPQAHTDGDIYVAFPEEDVIVAGDVVTANQYPVLDYITGGWIGGMSSAIEALIAMAGPETLIVPGTGPARRRGDLQAQLEMLEAVRERIEKSALRGLGVDDMLNEHITKDFDARYSGDVALFISNAYEGMWWNRIRGIGA
jgi:glyoxylase-like metal-dependent hydrolase (beta-lactamase superfamily II)